MLRRTGLALLTALALTSAVPADVVLTITQVGSPIWKPADFHVFTAPGEPGNTVGLQTASSILPPPNHIFTPAGVIVPGTAHAGPYDQEIRSGLAKLGISDSQQFALANYAGTPNSIWLAYMLVPNPGTTGSSPDFASGPIIPEALFPIVGTFQVFRDGQPFDSGTVTTRKLADLPTPIIADGSSHRPQLTFWDLVTADNPQGLKLADLPGHFEFRGQLRDASGNGFNVVVPFDVLLAVPEPGSVFLFGVGVAALAGVRWTRRRGRSAGTPV